VQRAKARVHEYTSTITAVDTVGHAAWTLLAPMARVNYLVGNLVALAGLLSGATVVHNIYKPDLVCHSTEGAFLCGLCHHLSLRGRTQHVGRSLPAC
jgi:Domain of unknown function (DUF4516)